MTNKEKNALRKATVVARKEGNSYYAELQGVPEYLILSNEETKEQIKKPFVAVEDAIKNGRSVLEKLQFLSVLVPDIDKIELVEVA